MTLRAYHPTAHKNPLTQSGGASSRRDRYSPFVAALSSRVRHKKPYTRRGSQPAERVRFRARHMSGDAR